MYILLYTNQKEAVMVGINLMSNVICLLDHITYL